MYLIIIALTILLIVSWIRNNKRSNQYKEQIKDYEQREQHLLNATKEELESIFEKEINANKKRIEDAQNAIKTVESMMKNNEQLQKQAIDKELEEWQEATDIIFNRYVEQSTKDIKYLEEQIKLINEDLENAAAKRHSINEAIRREEEIQAKAEYYKIAISENDREDISVLESIKPKLHNNEDLNKLIYSLYIQKPLKDLTSRICGQTKKCGIYKITYNNGKCYIGKSTDIANRWSEHIKSSLSIGTIAHSNFHTALEENGVWNYTWEILEEVPKEKLTEREKYWITFYESHIYGYNQKIG